MVKWYPVGLKVEYCKGKDYNVYTITDKESWFFDYIISEKSRFISVDHKDIIPFGNIGKLLYG